MAEIKFGTDGWRGLIADDFTFENVRRVAGAIASYVLKNEDPSCGVVVGYDTRFASQHAARVVAHVIAQAGIPVQLADDTCRLLQREETRCRGRRNGYFEPQSI